MAVELVSRQFAGHGEDGSPQYDITWHGRPRPPESAAEWAGQRVGGWAARRACPQAGWRCSYSWQTVTLR